MSRCEHHGRIVSQWQYAMLILLIALVALLAILLAWPWPAAGMGKTPDSLRFQEQAQSMLDGRGFSFYGKPSTILPPGYPILLAFVLSMNAERVLLGIQIAFFLSATLFLFLGVSSSRTIPVAGCIAGLLAINPWIARTSFHMLSENLGILLSAVIVFLISTLDSCGRYRSRMMLMGVLLVILPLTSPATQPLCFFLAVALLIGNLHRWNKAWLIAGAAIPFLLWQWHCVVSSGRPGIPLYTANIGLRNEGAFVLWFRGWATSEADFRYAWNPDEAATIASLPARAFRSDEERREVVKALSRLRVGGVAQQESERTLQIAARNREADDRFRFHILLPLIRAKSLWVRMPTVGHIQETYVGRLGIGRFLQDRQDVGNSRAAARFAKGIVSTAGYVLWLTIPILFLLACFFPSPDRRALSVAVVAGVILYTAISGYTAFGEARRNLVFYPFMLWVIGSSRLLAPRTSLGALGALRCSGHQRVRQGKQ